MHIPQHQTLEGATLAHANALSLLESAKLLRSQGLHGLAASLAVLSAEESSKALALLGHKTDGQDPKALRDVFTKHSIKISIATLNAGHLQELLSQIKPFSLLAPEHKIGEAIAESVKKWEEGANDLKQAGFYVSFSEGSWRTPQQCSSDESSLSFFVAALGLVSVAAQLPKHHS
jgi:AbiV family abortive infection protein